VLYRLATRREYERCRRAAMTLQQQQEQGEGHRCNEMMSEEQQQIEASSEHNGGVERSDANGEEFSILSTLPLYLKIKLSLLVRLARRTQHESRRCLDSVMLQGGDIQEGLRTTFDDIESSSINIHIPNITVDNPDIIHKVQKVHQSLTTIQNAI